MRDVIVIGAGGGGAVVAKELAARGLDVLVLEAGANANPQEDWTHFEIDQSNTVSGALRFGPADRSKPPWARELAQNSLIWQVVGVGGTTQHYFANSPARSRARSAGTAAPMRQPTTACTSFRSRTRA
jgi:choline dehydrogenase-like flavoprotein